jgi:hypothetical protein
MVDTINTILRELSQIPGPIFPAILCFIFGYWFGGIFTTAKNRQFWSSFWRCFAVYILAASGLIDGIMRHRVLELFFVGGILYAARPFITSFWNWTVDLLSAVFKVLWQVVTQAYRLVEAVAILLARIVSYGKQIPKIGAMGWKQSGAAFAGAKAQGKKDQRDSDEFKREQERRAEDLRREYARRAESEKRSQEQNKAQRQAPPPPPKPERDPARSYQDALWYYELDEKTVTPESLKQAHKKKILALHPDKWADLPKHLLNPLEEEMKTSNLARDLIRKVKGW